MEATLKLQVKAPKDVKAGDEITITLDEKAARKILDGIKSEFPRLLKAPEPAPAAKAPEGAAAVTQTEALKRGLKALLDDAVASALAKDAGPPARVDLADPAPRKGSFVSPIDGAAAHDADWAHLADLAEAASREAGRELAKASGSPDPFAGCIDLAAESRKTAAPERPDVTEKRRHLQAELAKCGHNDMNRERLVDAIAALMPRK